MELAAGGVQDPDEVGAVRGRRCSPGWAAIGRAIAAIEEARPPAAAGFALPSTPSPCAPSAGSARAEVRLIRD
ncbi:hypothetical protein KCH_00050 [Kitasatospora cheerisanensis KCTC 2395]|uniref:Uncharacterized protein n=1 Tax=Kitasatospora cheerisanensis KCTC 2395 TaxID=1348663 RepID=A0A066Z3A0_9ACTN|nr:hypothetical protein KCH_00050 [Kitasatospora cheerisanensis KCTC 2395]